MELRVEPGSDEEFSFWRFSRKRRNPEPTGGIRPHILLALQHVEQPPLPRGGPGKSGRVEGGLACWMRKNAAVVLVIYTRRSSIPTDEKESEIKEQKRPALDDGWRRVALKWKRSLSGRRFPRRR